MEKNQKKVKMDLTGRRFGRLVVVKATDKRSGRAIVWRCLCDCGKNVEVRSTILRSGRVKSCGCIKKEADRERFLKNLTYVDNTCIEFLENIKVPTKASTTGVRGVSQMKNGKYKAELTFQKKRKYLGVYKTLDEAMRARRQAEIKVEEYLETVRNEHG